MRKPIFLGCLVAMWACSLGASSAHAQIAWHPDLRAAHAQAEAQGKLMLLHFYTDNCVWCDRLEKGSYKNAQVCNAVNTNFIPVKVNAGSNPDLAKMFKVTKFPTDVVVTTGGQTLVHTVSPQDPQRYVAMLSKAMPQQQPGQPAVAMNPAAAAPQPAATAPKPATTAPQTNMMAQPAVAAQSPAQQMQLPQMTLPTSTQVAQSAPTTMTMPTQQPAAQPKSNQFALPSGPTATNAQLTSARQAPAKVPAPATLPEPELAMEGFCPVTVINEDRWVEGNPKHGVIHLGKLYLFSDAEKMEKFLADPVPFTPVLNEIDVVRFFEERKIVQGKREWGLKDPTHNRMFFFADEAAMNHFWNEYERYTGAAIEVMDKAIKDSNPGT